MKSTVLFCEEISNDLDGRYTYRGVYTNVIFLPSKQALTNRFGMVVIFDLEPNERPEKIWFGIEAMGAFIKSEMEIIYEDSAKVSIELNKPIRILGSANFSQFKGEVGEPLRVWLLDENDGRQELIGEAFFALSKDFPMKDRDQSTADISFRVPIRPPKDD